MKSANHVVKDATNWAADSANAVAEESASVANGLVDKGSDFMHQAKDKAAAFASRTYDSGAALLQQAKNKGSEFKKVVADKSADALQASENYIKENPHKSVASGFGMGVLVGCATMFLLMTLTSND